MPEAEKADAIKFLARRLVLDEKPVDLIE